MNNDQTVIEEGIMKSNNAELNRLDEIMSQNIQLSNEQNVNSLYNIQKFKGEFTWKQRGLSGSTQSQLKEPHQPIDWLGV